MSDLALSEQQQPSNNAPLPLGDSSQSKLNELNGRASLPAKRENQKPSKSQQEPEAAGKENQSLAPAPGTSSYKNLLKSLLGERKDVPQEFQGLSERMAENCGPDN